MSKNYRLKKDLPTLKAGEELVLTDNGDLFKGTRRIYPKTALDAFLESLGDGEWFEEIPEKRKTADDLRDNDPYYVIDDNGDVYESIWCSDETDCKRREAGNAFTAMAEADKEAARRKAETILRKDTKGFKVKKDGGRFYYVEYDMYSDKFFNNWLTSNYSGAYIGSPILFATAEDAQDSIRNHAKEWKIYLGVEE